MLILVSQIQALSQVIIGVTGISGGKIDHDHADGSAHAGTDSGFRAGFRKKVHVVETGNAAFDHLGARELRAIQNKLSINVLIFCRPDVLIEPCH